MREQQRVLIFGAGDSVGRLTAEMYAAVGARVHICDVNEQALARTLAENPTLTGAAGDVGVRGDVDRVAREATEVMGGIDVMVNFVGIAGPRAEVEDVSDEDWQASLQINLTGAFYAMRAVIPGMKRQRSGAIVNISSASTRTGIPARSPYVVSKCAIEGLVRNAARELGPFNIRCNAVLPGALKNARMDFVIQRVARTRGITPEAFEAEMLKFTSMRTRIDLKEVADLVMFLCSDRAPHVTGQLIEVSGGLEWEE
jgi:NAD(P)-dependent dehydrogenase (short-subunit alcohol dehydrogenase family)